MPGGGGVESRGVLSYLLAPLRIFTPKEPFRTFVPLCRYTLRMARLDIRLSDSEKAELVRQAELRGVSVSRLVRERVLGLAEEEDRLAAVERRLDRLEGMAGL